MFHGHCTTNPARAIRRKLTKASPREMQEHLRALPYREVHSFMERLRQAPGTAARCLEFALLTAARTNEALTAAWSEIDFDAATWTIPAAKMKAKEIHVVYLSSSVIELLRAQRGQDMTLVFPSPMLPGRPMSNMAMLTVLDRLGMRDRTTVHGVRRASFSAWANETAAARPDVIEAALAHAEQDKIRQAYNRAEYIEERQALMNAWAGFLASPVEPNVLSLRVA